MRRGWSSHRPLLICLGAVAPHDSPRRCGTRSVLPEPLERRAARRGSQPRCLQRAGWVLKVATLLAHYKDFRKSRCVMRYSSRPSCIVMSVQASDMIGSHPSLWTASEFACVTSSRLDTFDLGGNLYSRCFVPVQRVSSRLGRRSPSGSSARPDQIVVELSRAALVATPVPA